MPNDMDADHSPAFIKLARLPRDQIRSGEYKHGDELPSSNSLARNHGISRRTALHALEVLAANNYVARTGESRPYRVGLDAARADVTRQLRVAPYRAHLAVRAPCTSRTDRG